ncbi:MAG: cobalamin-binding protein [Anaerolineales bacterium]|nr:MAG: cobalamin-binding protein [Anaerolineales bacterium]
MYPIIKEIYQNILYGQQNEIVINIHSALDSGFAAKTVLDEGMITAMAEIGRQFEAGECFIPEMLVAARAMQVGLTALKPSLNVDGVKATGIIAVGTVKGDLHDIGKNLVALMLEGAGFDVMDLGADVDKEEFVAIAESVNIIALSAMLTTTMPNMKEIIDALTAAGKRSMVKVIVGGAPLNEAYAKQLGSDGYAPDASSAVTLTKSLLAI